MLARWPVVRHTTGQRDKECAPCERIPGTWVKTLETKNYVVTIRHLCEEEGHVSCNRILYRGVAQKSGKETTLVGSTWHAIGADGTTLAISGYRFKSGEVTYIVLEDGTLRVVRGDAEVLVEEKGSGRSSHRQLLAPVPLVSRDIRHLVCQPFACFCRRPTEHIQA